MSITTGQPGSPAPAAPAAIAMPADDPGPPEPPRERLALRLLLGCLIVVLCAAGVGATFVLEQVHTLRDALRQNKALSLPSGTLAPAGWGDPQTLLLVGDDQRALTGEFKYYSRAVPPHSNEQLLVRIDPSKPYISMMSIPRELMVTILAPGQAPITTRFNYAYTAGGIPLLVSTIKQVLGLPVNHVMVVTFGRFKRAVDEMGCVYSTVDRRYYHVNVPGGEQYQEINLQPGYQDMCGTQALEFVSYRHGDTSLVRDARDQSFLLDVKKQYGPTLADNIGEFERIFGQAVQTDPGLQSTTGLLNLIGTLISSSGRRVRQVQFQANLAPSDPRAIACACVTASPQQIASSVHAFLYGGSPIPKQTTAAAAHAVHSRTALARLPLVATGASELAQARRAARGMPFPYEYPRVRDRGGSSAPVFVRDYLIHAPDHRAYPIYVAVFSVGQLGQYYDVQGTTWTTPPMLNAPDQTVHVGGRTYNLYYEGDNLKLVAWYEHGAAYWIRNSLTDAVGNGELLAIAEQTQPVAPSSTTTGTEAPLRVTLNAAAVPARSTTAPKTELKQTLGSLAGMLTLLAVPALTILLIRRRRELSAVRGRLKTLSQQQAQLTAALGGSATAPAEAGPASTHSTMSVYSAGRPTLRAAVLAAVGVATVAVAVALGVLLATEGGTAQTVPAARHPATTRARKRAQLPAVPLAVLNATATPRVAARMAQQLRADGATIATVGNLAESRPSGTWILYAPGERNQAGLVARLLRARASTIAPIDPVAQAAAGTAARVVLVIAQE